MRLILGGLIIVVLGVMAYVRLAPLNAATYHVMGPPQDVGDTATAGSFTAVRPLAAQPDAVLKAIEDIALKTPRTTRMAGGVEEGILTFVTRSRVFGFPDLTTVYVDTRSTAPLLVIYGRLRYGAADLGVNQARVQSWLAQLGALVAAS